jgi:hypothetical protein
MLYQIKSPAGSTSSSLRLKDSSLCFGMTERARCAMAVVCLRYGRRQNWRGRRRSTGYLPAKADPVLVGQSGQFVRDLPLGVRIVHASCSRMPSAISPNVVMLCCKQRPG